MRATSTCCRSSGACSATGMPDARLRTVEAELLGPAPRTATSTAGRSPAATSASCAAGRPEPLADVVRHNDEDVRSLGPAARPPRRGCYGDRRAGPRRRRATSPGLPGRSPASVASTRRWAASTPPSTATGVPRGRRADAADPPDGRGSPAASRASDPWWSPRRAAGLRRPAAAGCPVDCAGRRRSRRRSTRRGPTRADRRRAGAPAPPRSAGMRTRRPPGSALAGGPGPRRVWPGSSSRSCASTGSATGPAALRGCAAAARSSGAGGSDAPEPRARGRPGRRRAAPAAALRDLARPRPAARAARPRPAPAPADHDRGTVRDGRRARPLDRERPGGRGEAQVGAGATDPSEERRPDDRREQGRQERVAGAGRVHLAVGRGRRVAHGRGRPVVADRRTSKPPAVAVGHEQVARPAGANAGQRPRAVVAAATSSRLRRRGRRGASSARRRWPTRSTALARPRASRSSPCQPTATIAAPGDRGPGIVDLAGDRDERPGAGRPATHAARQRPASGRPRSRHGLDPPVGVSTLSKTGASARASHERACRRRRRAEVELARRGRLASTPMTRRRPRARAGPSVRAA